MPLLDSTHVGPVKYVHDLTPVSIWIKQDHLPLYIDGLRVNAECKYRMDDATTKEQTAAKPYA